MSTRKKVYLKRGNEVFSIEVPKGSAPRPRSRIIKRIIEHIDMRTHMVQGTGIWALPSLEACEMWLQYNG